MLRLLFFFYVIISSCGSNQPVRFAAPVIDSFPKPIGWVNDFENIFSQAEVKHLDSIINGFEQRTTIEIAIVTVDTSVLKGKLFRDYTLNLANAWGIGKNEADNGVLIAMSRLGREIFIHTGIGIEDEMNNAQTKKFIDEIFIPH